MGKIVVNENVSLDGVIEDPTGAEGSARGGWFWDYKAGTPYQPPPWATLTALDLRKGTLVWQKPLGLVESLAARGITGTGSPGIGGGIVTAGGLVFIGYSNDNRFRAFDKTTGEELWVTKIEASGHAVPVTYLGRRTGRQFVVIASGAGTDATLTAFALRDTPR